MIKLGISDAGIQRIARKMGQVENWQSRFEGPATAQQPAEQGYAAEPGVDEATIQQWIESIAQEMEAIQSVQPVESIRNLEAWVEYLNAELEAIKSGTMNQQMVPEYPNYDEAEAMFSGSPQEVPQQQAQPQSNSYSGSVWDSIKNFINKDVAQQTPRSEMQDLAYYY